MHLIHFSSTAAKAISYSLLLALLLITSACGNEDKHASRVQSSGFDIEDYEGKWLILNYWATWCGPCKEEIPELNLLQERYREQLTVLGVNYDNKQGEQLQKDIEFMGIKFGYIENNPAKQLKLSRPEGLPVTYLFSPDSNLAAKLVGPQSEEDIVNRINLLGGSL